MANPNTSIEKAPGFSLYRNVTVDDGLPLIDPLLALNTVELDDLTIQVIPQTNSNPVVSILFWSQEATKFVAAHGSGYTFSAKGAGIPWVATVKTYGLKVIVAVTGGMSSGETCKILVSGNRQF
jgi:hypothetical protein